MKRMKRHKWRVWSDDAEEDPVIVTATSPIDAASTWAHERGHDVDDTPRVEVFGPIDEDERMLYVFDLHASVTWLGTRVPHP